MMARVGPKLILPHVAYPKVDRDLDTSIQDRQENANKVKKAVEFKSRKSSVMSGGHMQVLAAQIYNDQNIVLPRFPSETYIGDVSVVESVIGRPCQFSKTVRV
jgi:hypothetical protein